MEIYHNKNTWPYFWITRWQQAGYICDCITWLVILLNKALCLSISAKHSKNGMLTRTMWDVINLKGVSRLIDLIDVMFLISNIKFANPAISLSSWTDISSCCSAFN